MGEQHSGFTVLGSIDSSPTLWHREYHLSANQADPGASGATKTELNGIFSYKLDAVNEWLYYGVDIHNDWDESSDIIIEVTGYLTNAETANDLIRMSVRCDYGTDHDNANTFKTQTLTADHNIGALNAQYDVHKISFTLDYDLAANVLEVGDVVHLKVWLDDVTTAPIVPAFNIMFITVKYQATKVGIEI